MSENKMEQVAEMLGVELGEEFQIKEVATGEVRTGEYRLTENGLEYRFPDGWYISTITDAIGKIFTGELAIVKKPWKPNMGDGYYMPAISGDFAYEHYIWDDDPMDLLAYDRGLVFKTKNEAKEMTEKILDFVKEERGIE